MSEAFRSRLEITGLYAVISAVGFWVHTLVEMDTVWNFLIADIAMTFVVYLASVIKKNTSAYDAYWSVVPFLFMVWLALQYSSQWSSAQWAIAAAVSYWSWRLTLNWVRSWPGWSHEDYRYTAYRTTLGPYFELMNFFGLQFFPTIMVFWGCTPLFWALSDTTPSWAAVFPGIGIMCLGATLELVADNQLHAFRRRTNPAESDLLDSGLWSVVRHPNYLGEILFWVGACATGLAAGAPWYSAGGAGVIAALVVFASIPLKDTRMASRRSGFDAYRKATPAIIPGIHWPK